VSDARVAVAKGPLDRPGEPAPVERAEDLFEGDAELEAGEVCAQTEMDAAAEGEMPVRVAPEAELVRLGEVSLVAVGRALPHRSPRRRSRGR